MEWQKLISPRKGAVEGYQSGIFVLDFLRDSPTAPFVICRISRIGQTNTLGEVRHFVGESPIRPLDLEMIFDRAELLIAQELVNKLGTCKCSMHWQRDIPHDGAIVRYESGHQTFTEYISRRADFNSLRRISTILTCFREEW